MTITLSQPNTWFVHREGRTIACVVRDSLGYFFSWQKAGEEVNLLEAVLVIRNLKQN